MSICMYFAFIFFSVFLSICSFNVVSLLINLLRCYAQTFSSCGERRATFHCGVWASPSGGFSLQNTGSRHTGSVVVVQGFSCSMACGIFLDQGSNPCPLHWQMDSNPLYHQGSPILHLLNGCITTS